MASTAASAWPWMKNEKVAIAPPCSPTSDQDERPAILDLIQKHRNDIDELKGKLQSNPHYDEAKHDDLWLLRFLLSQKKVEPALKAAQHALQFRAEHNLDDKDIRSVHFGHDHDNPKVDPRCYKYQNCCDPDTFRFVVHERCVVSYIQWAGFDQPRLLKEVEPEEWLPVFMLLTEWSHQWCDYLTRTSGRLTKTIRVIDLENVGLVKNGNPKAAHRDAKAINTMEDVYPQLLQGVFVVDAPIWIQAPWKTIKPMIPKRVLDKFDFLEPSRKEKDLKKLTKYIDMEKLPSRIGGSLQSWPDETPPPIGKPIYKQQAEAPAPEIEDEVDC